MIRIAVLVSGGGTNLQALIDAQNSGIDESLQVGSSAGNQNSDPNHSRITFSSPFSILPMT